MSPNIIEATQSVHNWRAWRVVDVAHHYHMFISQHRPDTASTHPSYPVSRRVRTQCASSRAGAQATPCVQTQRRRRTQVPGLVHGDDVDAAATQGLRHRHQRVPPLRWRAQSVRRDYRAGGHRRHPRTSRETPSPRTAVGGLSAASYLASMPSVSTGIYRVYRAAAITEGRACQTSDPVAVSQHLDCVPDLPEPTPPPNHHLQLTGRGEPIDALKELFARQWLKASSI